MNKITICNISCGELTQDKCKESLMQFEGKVNFQEVKNICPQIKALNQMIDQCATEFLVPVDADMILYYGVWPRLLKGLEIMENNDKCHSVLYSLWDTLTEQKIYALKLLRTSVLKENIFMESCTPDIEHYGRLQRTGYHAVDLFNEFPIGDHVVKGLYFCYHKYRDVYMTLRSHKRIWCQGVAEGNSIRECAYNHYKYLIAKYNQTNNLDYMACIVGMMDGINSKLEHKSKSLDKPMSVDPRQGEKMFCDWYRKKELDERF